MKYQYESQRVAYPYFIAAMVLFAAQILFGLVIGYTVPLVRIFSFRPYRSISRV